MNLSARPLATCCALSLLATLGFGCTKNTSSTKAPEMEPAGPKAANFENLSPDQAAKKISLTSGTVVSVHQSFSGLGEVYAASRGWGKTIQREILVKSFAPGNLAEVDWVMKTAVTSTDGKIENKILRGNIQGFGLRDTHDLLIPTFWKDDLANAGGRSGLWISTDVFADLIKNHRATMNPGFGLDTTSAVGTLPPTVAAALTTLSKDIEKLLPHKDLYETTSDPELKTMDLNLNHMRLTVQVLHAKNWFGDYDILVNEQYPIVLKFVPSAEMNRRGLSGLLGYEVTEIFAIQE